MEVREETGSRNISGDTSRQQGEKSGEFPGSETKSEQQARTGERLRHRPGDGLAEEQDHKTKRILYTNVQSIHKKLGELEAVTVELKPDFILLTVSWCNSQVPDASLSINGYSLETDLR
jgi:hypothetical protein